MACNGVGCHDVGARTLANMRSNPQKNMAHILVEQEISANDPLPKDYLDPIKALWADGGVSRAMEKGNEYALHDNLA